MVSSRFAPLKPGAIASISKGVARTPARTSIATIKASSDATAPATRSASRLSSRARRAAYTGMKEAESAPSPNRFCRKFGIRKPALKATRRFRDRRVAVLEKENAIARHQTGHNSGVIHSGIYYKPGSLKANNCVAGAAAMVEFCRQHNLAFQICGKVVVATAESELPGLQELMRRGTANGVPGLAMIHA